MKTTPKFYNCLEETKNEIFSLLFQGVEKRKSKFHNVVLNTISLEKKPEARIVVLRNFCKDELTLNIHSDQRSKKIKEIISDKNVCLVFYDEQKKIQLRVRGEAILENSKKKSWEKLSNWSRRCYLTLDPPGKLSDNPTSGFSDEFSDIPPSKLESEMGYVNFSLIKIFITQIEWLYLASQGHRRALFEVKRNNSQLNVTSKWMVP